MRPKNKGREHHGPTSQVEPAHDALLRLATNPQDACALVAVYDEYGDELKASAVRWFGKEPEVRNKAVNSILVAIAQQAATYDQHLDARAWVGRVADAEARRLSEALDETLRHPLAAKGDV